MCDEYDDERMAVFWRRLEQLDGRKHALETPEEEAEPLVRIEPASDQPSKTRPRVLSR